MIPKILHYCWFGRGEKSELLSACIASWAKLEKCGYTIREWNEDNCDINENKFVKRMYDENKYAFVSDYFRLRALTEYGGVYLDTDVWVYKPFDDLLSCDLFLGYIYDCALGTAVIGASKGNTLVSDLLRCYDDIDENGDVVNNGLVTEYFYRNVQEFRLNGRRQSLTSSCDETIEIYPKEEFEAGRVIGCSHTLHFADGSWGSHEKKTPSKIKVIAARLPVNVMSIQQHRKANAYMKRAGRFQRWFYEENLGQ